MARSCLDVGESIFNRFGIDQVDFRCLFACFISIRSRSHLMGVSAGEPRVQGVEPPTCMTVVVPLLIDGWLWFGLGVGGTEEVEVPLVVRRPSDNETRDTVPIVLMSCTCA